MQYLGICIFPKNFQTNCGVHLDIKQRFQVFLFGLLSCLIVPPLHHGYALTLQGCSWAHGGLGFHFWLCDPGKVQHRPEVLASGFVAETLRPQGLCLWCGCVWCVFLRGYLKEASRFSACRVLQFQDGTAGLSFFSFNFVVVQSLSRI